MTSSHDPKAVGIAPAALSEFIADLQSNVDGGYPQLNSFKSAFSRYGISTGNIAQIERILKWVNDQMPMLRRRQGLAQQVGTEKFDFQSSVPMVTAGAGVLDGFRNSDDARRAGRGDADSTIAALKGDRDLSDVLGRLRTNALDPDYTEAFYRRLGPSGIRALSLAASKMGHDGHLADAKSAREAIGKSLATASHRIQIDDKWLNQLASSPAIAVSEGPATLAPFLEYGNFDKEWLKLLGAHTVSGNVRPGPAQKIWQALAKNPRASTEFYYDHFPEIQHYINVNGPGLSRDVADAFANVVRAATIDGRKVDRWRAEFNASQTIYFWKDHSNEHTIDAMRKTYADLAKVYWPDLVYSVTSPVKEAGSTDNPFRQGIEVSEDAWKSFLEEAMRNPSVAAEILTKHRLWLDQTRQKAISETPDGADPANWEGPSIAAMREFLRGAYDDVSSEVATQGAGARDKWNQNVKDSAKEATKWLVDKGIEKLNPGADIQWATSTASLVAGKGLDYLFGDDGASKVGQPQKKSQFSGRDSWQANANALWSERLRHGHHSFDPVRVQGGKPSDGDVRHYERKYGSKFTDQDGNILSLFRISQDPRALLAYNEWLKDPAVIKATEKFVRQEQSLPGGS
jgi:hypothetical protein